MRVDKGMCLSGGSKSLNRRVNSPGFQKNMRKPNWRFEQSRVFDDSLRKVSDEVTCSTKAKASDLFLVHKNGNKQRISEIPDNIKDFHVKKDKDGSFILTPWKVRRILKKKEKEKDRKKKILADKKR